MHPVRSAVALLGVAALALPAAAAAKGRPDNPGHGHGHANAHRVMYVFRGTWNAGSVDVTAGNRHARRAGLVGQSLEFDLASARVVVRDVNGDGARDLSDVTDGDRVVVQARLPKGDPGAGPFAARKLVDRAGGGDQGSTGSDGPAGSEDPAGSGGSQPEQD